MHRLVVGQQFGKWKVERRSFKQDGKNAYWKCRCDCGTTGMVRATYLAKGRSRQCQDCSRRNLGSLHRRA